MTKPAGPPTTLLEAAKRLRNEPHTVAGLSPEQTQKLAAQWAEKMKPILVAAARERRAIAEADLKALAGTDDGDGVTLDDALNFLLSPAGAHLQKVLESAVAPDNAIPLLPGLDDTPDPPPYVTPPKDSFEAHLREARVGDAFGLSSQHMLRAAVKGFAELTGKNGKIDEEKVKGAAPLTSALYTLIAEKAGGAKNTVPGQKLVGLGTDVITRVGRGIDAEPIRARMKGFDAVVADLLQGKQPLKGMKVVAIQHVLPTFSGVLDALEAAGVARADMRVIGKSYSTVDEMYAWMLGQGYDVHDSSFGGDAANVEATLVAAAKDTLTELFADVDPKTSTERFLLADDGGKLLHCLHTHFPEYAHLCSGFEQTARGIQVLDKMLAEGQPVLCPVVNMARSELKSKSEIPLIGENIVFDSLAYLDELKLPHPKTATVLGYGPVGEQAARALAARGIDVVVYDPSPDSQEKARAKGYRVMDRDAALGAADLVVGCTGRGAVDVTEEHAKLKNGAVLVNGASGNHELGTQHFGQKGRWFLEMAFEPDRFQLKNGAASAMFQGKSIPLGTGDLGSPSMHRVLKDKKTNSEVLVLRSGHVVNLGKDLPPEFIQVTRALVFASIVQSSTEKSAGVVDVDANIQAMIEGHINNDLARLGLSMKDPDFSSLQSWELG